MMLRHAMSADRRYLPAASLHFLLPAYDPIMRLLGFRRALGPLLTQAELRPGDRVLDVGCGTGTLAVMIKTAHPDVDVTGVDPDPRALERAVRKAARAGVSIRFDRGFGDALACPDAAFDRVFSSMMFHHVPREEKPSVLREARRVLKPAGRLEFLDFDNERLLRLMQDAGFADGRRLAARATIAGTIAYYQARA
jgi:ubiquinone/menaquinone biosynthesis C-methylase UbiE